MEMSHYNRGFIYFSLSSFPCVQKSDRPLGNDLRDRSDGPEGSPARLLNFINGTAAPVSMVVLFHQQYLEGVGCRICFRSAQTAKKSNQIPM